MTPDGPGVVVKHELRRNTNPTSGCWQYRGIRQEPFEDFADYVSHVTYVVSRLQHNDGHPWRVLESLKGLEDATHNSWARQLRSTRA